jgi:hypothetical protein
VRLTPEQRAKLKRFARLRGLHDTQILRQLIDQLPEEKEQSA